MPSSILSLTNCTIYTLLSWAMCSSDISWCSSLHPWSREHLSVTLVLYSVQLVINYLRTSLLTGIGAVWTLWSSRQLWSTMCMYSTCMINTCMINTCMINTCMISTCMISTCMISTCMISTCMISACVISTYVISTCVQYMYDLYMCDQYMWD